MLKNLQESNWQHAGVYIVKLSYIILWISDIIVIGNRHPDFPVAVMDLYAELC